MKKILKDKNKLMIFIFIIGAFIITSTFILFKKSNQDLMLEYINTKYKENFTVVNYINSKDYDNGDTDILNVIPTKKLEKDEDVERLMGDQRVSSVYYNIKTKVFEDNYFGSLIKESYTNEINDFAQINVKNYKLYFSLFSTMTFEDDYSKIEDFLKYKTKNGNPSAIFNIFFEINNEYTIENAKDDFDTLLKELAKNEYPITITAYFMEKTKISDLQDDLNLSIGIMNETENKQPESLTYDIDKDFSIKLNENIKKEPVEESDITNIEIQ